MGFQSQLEILVYRDFICGPHCKPSSVIFILGVYMSDGCQWYHSNCMPLLPGLVYPPEILMRMKLPDRCHYISQHTTSNWHTAVVFFCTSPCLPPHGPLHLTYIPLSKALQTNIMQVNNGNCEE